MPEQQGKNDSTSDEDSPGKNQVEKKSGEDLHENVMFFPDTKLDVSEHELGTLLPHGVQRNDKNKEFRRTVSWTISDICKEIGKISDKHKLAEIADAVFDNSNFDPTLFQKLEYVPFTPTEYWIGRDTALNETPVQFINRVYADALDGYFTTADLGSHDSSLRTALNNWVRDHNKGKKPSLDELNLPTKQEVNDKLLARYNLFEDALDTSPKMRALFGLRDTIRNRSRLNLSPTE